MSLIIDFWGVRGSLPLALPPSELANDMRKFMIQFFEKGHSTPDHIDAFLNSTGVSRIGGYGSATTCIQVSSELQTLIIDCGTGIKYLGDQLMLGAAGQGRAKLHIFLTHFHWDHLIGLASFKPSFIEGNEIIFYSVEPKMEFLLKQYLSEPWVSKDFSKWLCKLNFQILEPRESYIIDDLTITPYMMDHPDPCWGYKVTSGNKSYAHCADTEAIRVTPQSLGEDLPMYQNIDLMYFDAQYTLGQLADRINWGHSAAQIGLDLAFRENIKHILFAHHDPISTVATIDQLNQQTEEYYQWKIKQAQRMNVSYSDVQWGFVYEGQKVIL